MSEEINRNEYSKWGLIIITIFYLMAGGYIFSAFSQPRPATSQIDKVEIHLMKNNAGEKSVLLQPTKIIVHPPTRRLFISDSEHNRIIVTNPEGEVLTVIGSGQPGKRDGDFQSAMFSRPAGIAYDEKQDCLYVADSGNHLIRKVDFKSGKVFTLIGTGKPGYKDGKAPEAWLNTPGDVALLVGKLYIADTGNSLIRVYDLTKEEVSTLTIKKKTNSTPTPAPTEEPFYGKRIDLPEKKIAPSTKTLHFRLLLPEGCKWNIEAPNSIKVISGNDKIISIPSFTPGRKLFDYAIPISIKGRGKTILKIRVEAFYCEPPPEALCHPVSMEFHLPVSVEENGNDTLSVIYEIGGK